MELMDMLLDEFTDDEVLQKIRTFKPQHKALALQYLQVVCVILLWIDPLPAHSISTLILFSHSYVMRLLVMKLHQVVVKVRLLVLHQPSGSKVMIMVMKMTVRKRNFKFKMIWRTLICWLHPLKMRRKKMLGRYPLFGMACGQSFEPWVNLCLFSPKHPIVGVFPPFILLRCCTHQQLNVWDTHPNIQPT